MGIIQREIDRIRSQIVPHSHPRQAELYAAQQALEWALEPSGVASPFQMITGNEVGPEDCSARPHPTLS